MIVTTLLSGLALAASGIDATALMGRVAANVEKTDEVRRHYIYRQKVVSALVRTDGRIGRRERREYAVLPGEQRSEKKLESFSGEYTRGRKAGLIPYTEPGFKYKELDLDGEILNEVTSDLVDDKDSRDGIPRDLFPLRSSRLSAYQFQFLGETTWHGRAVHRVGFQPGPKNQCTGEGSHHGDCDAVWRGEIWVDALDEQPVKIDTHLAVQVPWTVRTFTGTNVKQAGFSVTYLRVDSGLWFPATYGTEFQLRALFGYRRTLTLSLESKDFRRTAAQTRIEYGQ